MFYNIFVLLIIILINSNSCIQLKLLPQTRIVGGKTTIIENFPYHLSIRYNNQPICGGALLTKTIAISAAHCFQRNGAYSVQIGSTYLIRNNNNNNNNNNRIIHIKKVIIHPQYNTITQDYDVCLLFLSKTIKLTKTVQPIKLPKTPPHIDEIANITGWGFIDEFIPIIVQQLRYTQIKIINYHECKRIYQNFVITPRMLCAGYPNRDSCQGDSGGPLVINNTIYGIISWGVGCADPRYPGVYTNITAVRDFITEYANL